MNVLLINGDKFYIVNYKTPMIEKSSIVILLHKSKHIGVILQEFFKSFRIRFKSVISGMNLHIFYSILYLQFSIVMINTIKNV